MNRTEYKMEMEAQRVAREIVTGTLPDEGVMVFPTAEDAQRFLARVRELLPKA